LNAGKKLFQGFCRVQQIIRALYNRYSFYLIDRIIEESALTTVEEISAELKNCLEEFD
jgi:hypothetical protein